MNTTMIDLRSDTVTHPTKSMRDAMATAEVGDDVYGEDPTVNRLEERAAELMGREAAVYVPTGTMGNQIAIHIHTHPGSEVVAEAGAHVFNFEMGAMAAISGALPRPVETADGILDPEQVEAAIQPSAGYRTPTSLLVLENSHNLAGGRVTPPARMTELVAVARRHGLSTQVLADGSILAVHNGQATHRFHGPQSPAKQDVLQAQTTVGQVELETGNAGGHHFRQPSQNLRRGRMPGINSHMQAIIHGHPPIRLSLARLQRGHERLLVRRLHEVNHRRRTPTGSGNRACFEIVGATILSGPHLQVHVRIYRPRQNVAPCGVDFCIPV